MLTDSDTTYESDFCTRNAKWLQYHRIGYAIEVMEAEVNWRRCSTPVNWPEWDDATLDRQIAKYRRWLGEVEIPEYRG